MKIRIKFILLALTYLLCVYFCVHTITTQIKRFAVSHTVISTEEKDGKLIDRTYKTRGFSDILGRAADFVFGGNFADESLVSAVSANFDTERETVIKDEPAPAVPENTAQERNISAAGGKSKLNSLISINNETQYTLDTASLLDGKKAVESKKKVLIVHTHATESYQPDESFNFAKNENDRHTDNNFNMVKIGDEVANELEKYGISTLHIRTQHDYPKYNDSYSRSAKSVKEVLEQNPDISLVLDLHRDAIMLESGEKAKLVCDINGEKVAQVMLVVGTDELGLAHESWRTNLKFAVQLQEEFLNISPDFARPVNLRTSRFNGHLAPGAVIIEVGCAGNSFSEAAAAAKYIAQAIDAYIKK